MFIFCTQLLVDEAVVENMERRSNRSRKPTLKFMGWYGLRMVMASCDRQVQRVSPRQSAESVEEPETSEGTQCSIPVQDMVNTDDDNDMELSISDNDLSHDNDEQEVPVSSALVCKRIKWLASVLVLCCTVMLAERVVQGPQPSIRSLPHGFCHSGSVKFDVHVIILCFARHHILPPHSAMQQSQVHSVKSGTAGWGRGIFIITAISQVFSCI